MSESGLINSENINVNCIEDQTEVLKHIEAKNADEVLPPRLFETVKAGLAIEGIQTIKHGSEIITLNKSQNNILTVQCSHSLKAEYKKQMQKNPMLRLAAKQLPDMYKIDEYYFIDLETGKAFDASILWETDSSTSKTDSNGNRPNGKTVAVSTEDGRTFASYIPNAKGGTLTINSPEKNQEMANRIENELGQNGLELAAKLALFHESGHKFQFDQYADEVNRNSSLINLLRTVQDPKVLEQLYRMSPTMKTAFENQKQIVAEQERNAMAFGLSVIKKLKSTGLDLTRGMTTQQVFDTVDYFLRTYEKTYLLVDGPAISQSEKKNKRIAGDYPAKKRETTVVLRQMGYDV